MAKVKVKGGGEIELADGSPLSAALATGRDGGKAVVAARLNGELADLSTVVTGLAEVEWVREDSAEGLAVLRHSASHILAEAVGHLYRDVKFAIGPATSEGFYYDFELSERIGEGDLARIAGEMEKIARGNGKFLRTEVSREEALRQMRAAGQDYKVELIRELPEGESISFYRHGDFVDLCRGPHLVDSSGIRAFALLSVAGSYWRGDEKNKMLQRVYGTAFASKEALEEHLAILEEAKKRDHRKLGRQLGLFSFHDEGPGFAFWHAKGMVLMNALLGYWRGRHRRAGYEEVSTPVLLDRSLWEKSGHWDNYREKMYFTELEERAFAVKPMNCPGGLLIYRSDLHSYRELPMRVAEVGLVHRHEKSGELHGLLRVRQFHQDDAHIFCTPGQIEDEVVGVIKLVFSMYRDLGFENVRVELSTRPEKSIGSDEDWRRAEEALRGALARAEVAHDLNPREGAFYGPKVDFHLLDSLKRSWQCGTIQVDFAMPERFDLEYVDRDGARKRPIMIHRAVLGSIERFVGVLLEHTGGHLPVWLAPVQAKVLTVTDSHGEYARGIVEALRGEGLRVELDDRNEKVGHKIREAILAKVPYLAVVGDREVSHGTVSVREALKGDQGEVESTEFARRLREAARVP
ncbi:MAG: threonine--tRNA ligase [Planctomycetota bacterium]